MNSLRRIFASAVILTFFFNSIIPATNGFALTGNLSLPTPGSMVNLSPAYVPILIKGLKLHTDNPLVFDFIMDTGNTGIKADNAEFRGESLKLIKYFLAALTINEDDIWVNLSPYEKNRIITKDLSQTQLGRDMLAQDYILKQLSASLIYPEKSLGKKFWDRLYEKARQMYGADVQIPVNTLNKVWIIADKAKVFEHANAGFIVSGHLKVMMEEDYLALEKNNQSGTITKDPNTPHSLASSVIKDLVIPEIEQEVNAGKNFAPLRQMFYAMILATWYKQALKKDLLNQVYSDKKMVNGIGVLDPQHSLKVDQIYKSYIQAYKVGVFNYIKEDYDAANGQSIPRKYFSGGTRIRVGKVLQTSLVETPDVDRALTGVGDCAITVAKMNGVAPTNTAAMSVYAQELNSKVNITDYVSSVVKLVEAGSNLPSVAAAVEETINKWKDRDLRRAVILALPQEALTQNIKDEIAQITPGTQEREEALKQNVATAENFLKQVVEGHQSGWDKVIITSQKGMTPLYKAYLQKMVGVLFNKDVQVRDGKDPLVQGPQVLVLDETDFQMIPGKPVGNGGATAAVFKYLREKYGEDVFKESIMVLHAGGAGKRLPEAIAEGTKALTIVPRALPDGEVSTNLAEGIRDTYQMSKKVREAGGGIYVTNCDGFLMTNFDKLDIKNDQINILTAPATIARVSGPIGSEIGALGVLIADGKGDVIKFSEKPLRPAAADFFRTDKNYLATGLVPANTANYFIPERSIQPIIDAWVLINQGMEFDTAGDILVPLAVAVTEQDYIASKGKVSKAKVLDIFGKQDDSWNDVFKSPVPDKLVFQSDWETRIQSIPDPTRREKLAALIRNGLDEKKLAARSYKIIKPLGIAHNAYLGDLGMYEDLGETDLYLNGKTDLVSRVFGWNSRVNSDYRGKAAANVVLINSSGHGDIGPDSMVVGVNAEYLKVGEHSLVYDGTGVHMNYRLDVKDKEALFIAPVQISDGNGGTSRAVVPVWRQMTDDPKNAKAWNQSLEQLAVRALIEPEYGVINKEKKGDVSLWDMPMWPLLKEGDNINEALGWLSRGEAPSELYKSSKKVSMAWLLKNFDYPGKVEKLSRTEKAASSVRPLGRVTPEQDLGGISLSRKNLKMELVQEGPGIDIKIDPVLLAQFRRGNFTGVAPEVVQVIFEPSFQAAIGL